MGVIQGNAYIESVSYSLAHGPTPSTCQINYSNLVALVVDTPITIFVGGSQWRGRVNDIRDIKNESVGEISQVRAIDYRDDLAGRTVFGQFNMIDKDDGSIYQINEYLSSNDWINQNVIQGHISPRGLIIYLCLLANFSTSFSANVQSILYNAGANWRDTIYNVFNLDWNTGIKIHAALQEICTRLGIQFTIDMRAGSSRVLRFTVIGDPDVPDLSWEGIFATDSEVGVGVNAEVDTGVWIVGDRELDEFTDLPCSPGWNTAWNSLHWEVENRLEGMIEAAGLDFLTNTVKDFANAYGNTYLDPGFVEPLKFFNDFTIKDYIRTVPFRVYRIDKIVDYLTSDEYAGNKRVKLNHIVTPLISDPGVQYTVKAATVHRKTKKVKLPTKVGKLPTIQQSGVRLIESTGHVVFSAPRFKISDAAVLAKKVYLNPGDFVADAPTISCVFLGPVYRNFFGLNLRVGTKHVPNLRIAKVITDPTLTPADYAEFIIGDEKSADNTAADVATGYLWRNRVVKSGKDTFKGFAGHVPTGEINRVTVSLSESAGVVEEVTYSNDEPSIDYDPQIEQRRRVAQESLKREQEKLRTTAQRAITHESRLDHSGKVQAKATDHQPDHVIEAATGSLNRDGWAKVVNSDGSTYVAGQPVVGSPDATSGDMTSTALASITDGEKQILGICMYDTNSTSHIPTVIHGPGQALVVGPVVKGDTLVYDATNKALKKGDGGTCTSMADQSTTSAVLTPVRVGAGGSGGSGDFMVVDTVATTNQASLTGLAVTIDNVALNTDGMLVLLTAQTTAADNEVWIVHSGAWTRKSQPKAVGVANNPTNGAQFNLSIWELVSANTYSQIVTSATIVAAASTANIASLTGHPTIDTVSTLTDASLVLLKNQATASQNGVYKTVSAGWVKVGQPSNVFVTAGAIAANTMFILKAANTYQGITGIYT